MLCSCEFWKAWKPQMQCQLLLDMGQSDKLLLAYWLPKNNISMVKL